MASDFTRDKDADARDALHRSIDYETSGTWWVQRVPTPPDKQHPMLSMTPFSDDDNAEAPSRIFMYPPTCC